MTSNHPAVYRVVGIPRLVSHQRLLGELTAKFTAADAGIEIDATIVPTCYSDDDTDVALVSFVPSAPHYLDSLRAGGDDDVAIATAIGELTFDRDFYGLTQLYRTIKGVPIAAEYVT
jgi:hypothetical protein